MARAGDVPRMSGCTRTAPWSSRTIRAARSIAWHRKPVRTVPRAAFATLALATAAFTGLFAARPLEAQSQSQPETQNDAIVARADTLLIAGRIFSAESLYYIAVRRSPRDP